MARTTNIPEGPADALAWIFQHTRETPAPYPLEKPCRRFCKLDGSVYERPRQLCYQGVRTAASRVVFELTNQVAIGKNQVVRHRCDVPDCVEPDHLVLGSQSENVRDAVLRGRWCHGTRTKNNGRKFCEGAKIAIQDATALPKIEHQLQAPNVDKAARPGNKTQIHSRPLSIRDLLEILRVGHSTPISNLSIAAKQLAQRFGRTPNTIRRIWKGESFGDVLPDIPRISLEGHGRSFTTRDTLAQIRATWHAHPELQKGRPGFLRALAKFAGMKSVRALLLGKFRTKDPGLEASPISLDHLGFLPYPLPEGPPREGLLQPDHIRDIVARWNQGATLQEIARAYGRSAATISEILCRKTWVHVTRELAIRHGLTGPKRLK